MAVILVPIQHQYLLSRLFKHIFVDDNRIIAPWNKERYRPYRTRQPAAAGQTLLWRMRPIAAFQRLEISDKEFYRRTVAPLDVLPTNIRVRLEVVDYTRFQFLFSQNLPFRDLVRNLMNSWNLM